ncbi:hypothetical protein [uncultured Porphyromonas sp.]|uniref:hypothetical protein n=1 Tax=uncultured Porphyromonas sp. TaxID=159274 RepID=UPI0026339223|nr:hypothetical protein [uncultured Porphyromonas sp.]
MKRPLSNIFSNLIVGTLLALIGCLGFSSCKTRTTQRTSEGDKAEQPDTTTLVKPRPRPDGMGMVMYGTPTTMFEPKQIVEPEEQQ